MKVDNFTVEVRTSEGQLLPEVRQGNATYIVARPGSAFTVYVKRHDADSYTECVKVLLKVDGRCPGQAKRLKLGQGGEFKGWLQEDIARGEGEAQFADFVFQPTQADPQLGVTSDPASLPSGKIVVGFWNAKLQQHDAEQEIHAAEAAGVQQPQLEDGQKWFRAPSLATQAGTKRRHSLTFDARGKWQQTSLIKEVQLRYETAATLILREVLKPKEVAQHKAIVAAHGDGVAKHLAGLAAAKQDPGAADVKPLKGRHSTAADAAADTQEEKENASQGAEQESQQQGTQVKQEVGAAGGGGGSSGRKRVKVEGVAPLEVNGSAVQPDEYALCDLSQADNVPGWTVHKRAVEPVEEIEG